MLIGVDISERFQPRSFSMKRLKRILCLIAAACSTTCGGDKRQPAPVVPFDYVDYFGGKQNAHGRLLSNGQEASWWRINALSPTSMSICYKNSTTEFFNWDDDKIYQTGWRDSFEYRLDVTEVKLIENGVSTIIATSGPQIYAFRRKETAYVLNTVGIITQVATGIKIPYRHVQFYGAPYIENNGLMTPRRSVPMRETWEYATGPGGAFELVLDRVVTYALNTGPAFSITQTYPDPWYAAVSEIGDGSAYTCQY